MNNNWHTKHFKGALKTFKRSGILYAIAPLGIMVGMGALIDATIVMLQIVFATPPIPSILNNIDILTLLIILAIISIVSQNIIIVNTYKSATMKKIPKLKAIKNAIKLIGPTLVVHATTLMIAIAIIWTLSQLRNATINVSQVAIPLLIIIVGGLIFLTLFTLKTLTLHNLVGARRSLLESVKDSVNMLRLSHGMIIEHNIILFIINISALIVIFTITSISLFILSTFAFALSQFFGGASSLFLSNILITVINLLMMGALMLFNMAAWSELTKNLRRRSLQSTAKRLVKSYLPF